MNTDGYFCLFGQEHGRSADSIDEGPSRERRDLIRRHSLIVVALQTRQPGAAEPSGPKAVLEAY